MICKHVVTRPTSMILAVLIAVALGVFALSGSLVGDEVTRADDAPEAEVDGFFDEGEAEHEDLQEEDGDEGEEDVDDHEDFEDGDEDFDESDRDEEDCDEAEDCGDDEDEELFAIVELRHDRVGLSLLVIERLCDLNEEDVEGALTELLNTTRHHDVKRVIRLHLMDLCIELERRDDAVAHAKALLND